MALEEGRRACWGRCSTGQQSVKAVALWRLLLLLLQQLLHKQLLPCRQLQLSVWNRVAAGALVVQLLQQRGVAAGKPLA